MIKSKNKKILTTFVAGMTMLTNVMNVSAFEYRDQNSHMYGGGLLPGGTPGPTSSSTGGSSSSGGSSSGTSSSGYGSGSSMSTGSSGTGTSATGGTTGTSGGQTSGKTDGNSSTSGYSGSGVSAYAQDSAKKGMKNTGQNAKGGISNFFSTVKEFVSKGFTAIKTAVTSLVTNVSNMVKSLVAKIFPSKTVGDPVVITDGKFYSSDIDMSVNFGSSTFELNRNYSSQEYPNGALGKNWSSVFDTRIIRGTCSDNLKILKAKLAECEAAYVENSYQLNSNGLNSNYVSEAVEANQQIDYLRRLVAEGERNIGKAEFNKYSVHGFEETVDKIDAASLLFVDADGGLYNFIFSPETNNYQGIGQSIEKRISIENDGDGFIVSYIDGTKKYFDKWGMLTKIEDRFASSICFEYHLSDEEDVRHIKSVAKNNQPVLDVKWQNNRIVKVTDIKKDLFVAYDYDDKGCLISYRDTDGDVYRFVYDDSFDLTRMIKPDGSFIKIDYSVNGKTKDKRVSSVTNEEGYPEYFSLDKEKGETTYIDADGNLYVYNYVDDRITQEEVPAGYFVNRTYNDDGSVKSVASPYEIVEYSYDEYKNVTGAKYKDGTSECWSYVQPYNLLSSYVDRDGVKTEYTYSSKGTLEKIVRAGIVVQTFVYDSAGRIVEASGINLNDKYSYDNDGRVIADSRGTYRYDSKDRVVSYDTKDGYSWRFGYTDDNKIQTATYPGNLYEKNEYNSRKDLVRKTQKDLVTGDTRLFEYEYDSRHLVKKICSGIGNNNVDAEKNLHLTTTFEYYPSGKLKSITNWNNGDAVKIDAAGVKRTYAYQKDNIKSIAVSFVDSSGKEIGEAYEKKYSVKYSDGKKNLTIIDGCGNETTVKFNSYDDPVELVDSCGRKVTCDYSPAGVLRAEKNAFGGKIVYGWNDAFDKVSKISEDKTSVVDYTYDSMGRLESESFINGEKNNYEYYENNGLTTVTEKSLNRKSVSIYDSTGFEIESKISDSSGKLVYDKKNHLDKVNNRILQSVGDVQIENTVTAWGDLREDLSAGVKYSYDENGNCILVDDGKTPVNVSYNVFGKISSVKIGKQFTNYTYNAAGNLVRCYDNVGTIVEYGYDKAGNLISEKGRARPEKKYEYDSSGNLVKVFEAGQLIQSIDYSDDFKIEKITDANGNSRISEYDEYGNLKSITNRLGKKRSINYDRERGLVSYTDFNGKTMSVANSVKDNSRITTFADGSSEKIYYDSLGSIARMENKYGTQRYVYDSAHQLKTVVDGEQKINYGYDSFGNLKFLATNDHKTDYDYFENGVLSSVSHDDFKRSFVYNDLGQQIQLKDSSASNIYYEYDEIGRPVLSYQKDRAGNVVYAEGTIYGDDGRVAFNFDKDGMLSKYEYDVHGRVSKVYLPFIKPYMDDANKELEECGKAISNSVPLEKLSIDFGTRNAVESALRKIGLSVNCLNNNQNYWTETFVYDGNGNRISKETPAGKMDYEYDKENRLTKICGPSPIVFSYDANGNLLSRKSALVSWEWKYSQNNLVTSNSYSDYEKDSYFSTEYGYDCLGRKILKKDSNGNVLHNLYDGFSFDKIYEWHDKNNSYLMQLNGSENNSRVRYRDIDGVKSTERAFRSNKEISGCPFDRYYVYANGNLSAQFNDCYFGSRGASLNEEVFAFCTDNRRSVRSALNGQGDFAYGMVYGLNGQPHFAAKNSSDFISAESAASFGADIGFNGKKYDTLSGTYDYGFRNYSPNLARFETEDPIHDGENWYSYCKGDPVNHIDLYGLKNLPADMTGTMNDYGRDVLLGNSKNIYLHQQGCYVTTLSGIINTIKNKTGNNRYTPLDLNDEKSNFAASNQCVVTDAVCKNYNIKYDQYINGYSYKQIADKINELDKSDENYCLAVKLFITYGVNRNTSEHWVSTEGTTVKINGKEYVKVIGSNKTDNGTCRYGWLDKDGSTYAPIDQIIGLRAFRNDEPEVVNTKKNKKTSNNKKKNK